MLLDERTRRIMVESLVRVHGEEVADAIMGLFTDPVTKPQLETALQQLEERIDYKIQSAGQQTTLALQRSMGRQTIFIVLTVLIAVLGAGPLNTFVAR